MKIPVVHAVQPVPSVTPDQAIDRLPTVDVDIDIDSSTGLSPAETHSIDGMTLETSQRLTAAVSKLAAYFASNPEYAALISAPAAEGPSTVPAVPDLTRSLASARQASPPATDEPSSGPSLDRTFPPVTSSSKAPLALPAALSTRPSTDAREEATDAASGATAPAGEPLAGIGPANAGARVTRDDASPDDVAALADLRRAGPDGARGADPLLAMDTNELQVGRQGQDGDTGSGGEGSEQQAERGTATSDIEGAPVARRQQGALPLVPFNRRLETNGVDPTSALETAFLTSSHAYGGHDSVNRIMSLTIGAPRMSTDGGSSPLPMTAENKNAQAETPEELAAALPAGARLAAPLVVMPAASNESAYRAWLLRRRRRLRAAGYGQRPSSIRPHPRSPRIATNSCLSDPRNTGRVECAVCWVGAGSDRRGQRRYDAGGRAIRTPSDVSLARRRQPRFEISFYTSC